MAFVFRSPRITNSSQIESNAEQYPKEITNSSILNSTNTISSNRNNSQKLNKVKAPFGTTIKENIKFRHYQDNTPGPGSYEIKSDLIKNKFNNNNTSPDKDNSLPGNNKRLFISKKERLDIKQYETDVPGPGKYFPDSNKIKFNIYKTIQRRTKWFKPEKTISYQPFSTSRILSIPSKGLDFGYELNKNGELILSEDPGKNIKFYGTKNSSVGPGQYHSDTYNSKNKNKGIIDWNKSSSVTQSKKKKEVKDNNNITNLSQFDSSNYFFCSNSTEPTTNNNSISIINYNKKNRTKNYFYNGWDMDRKNFEIKFSNNKIYKNDNFAKTINRSNLSPFFKPDIKQTEFDITNKTEFIDNNDNYFATNYLSPKTESSNNQFFGSTVSRGIIFPKNKINNIKIGRNKPEHRKKIEIVSNTLNLSNGLNSSIKNINESKSDTKKNKIIIKRIDKAELIREIAKSLKTDYSSNPGPGSYDPQLIPKNNFSYEIGNFGSLERRFPVYKKTNEEEGILTYLHLDTWGPKKRTNYLKKIIPQNILKKLKEGLSMNKMNLFREKIMQESRIQPCLGTYDTEKINTIESRVKNAANASRNMPPFGIATKRILIEEKLKQDKNNKMGYLTQEEKIEKNEKKNNKNNYAPFLSKTRRDDIDNFNKIRIANIGGKIGGPGYYKTDSYFDWNKKSYNILFN